MALFQKTILRQFAQTHEEAIIQEAFVRFCAYFKDEKIRQELLSLKEEQLQESFLSALFGDVLGYDLPVRSNKAANLLTEWKNPKNNKKVDAAILQNGEAIGVIELKSAKTVDLDRVVSQAFEYKNSHEFCKYVLISNFRKLRFYIENSVDFEEFDLFELEYERFRFLYVILQAENVLKHLPVVLREQSIKHREDITLQFYNDYKQFKDTLFADLCGLNKKTNYLLLFEKAQRIADKIVFICFAQDRALLPANYLRLIVAEHERRRQEGDNISLYSLFVKHFGFINTGFKSDKYDIFGYNGGLFAPDAVADTLQITDTIFSNYALSLARYDFETDVDVNVLGHIFEHSLQETQLMSQQLASAGKLPATDNKRKLDGIFYTPLYITDYIIQETLGKLCVEKKAELNWENATVDVVRAYRDWLFTVTVLDPACGSGAFLNQVLNFFIQEHQKIDALESYLSGKSIYSDYRHKILENNIFGVDINAESVAITKLSLWLRIAEGKRKLNDLSHNIKRGNSLIDDKNIDAFAFDWAKEFPAPMKAGGFSLVVGNPPYVVVYDKPLKAYLENKFEEFKRNNDLYVAFFTQGLRLLKPQGVLSFITSNSFIKGQYFESLRETLIKNQLIEIIDFNNTLHFTDANVYSAITTLQKKPMDNGWVMKSDFVKVKGWVKPDTIHFIALNGIYAKLAHLPKMNDYFLIKDVGYNYWSEGSKKSRINSIGSRVLYQGTQQDSKDIPYLKGSQIFPYQNLAPENYLKYNYQDFLESNDTFRFSADILAEKPKLLYRQTSSSLVASLDYQGLHTDKTLHTVIAKENYKNDVDLKYLLAIFNSKLFNYLYKILTEEEGRAFAQVKTINVKQLPFVLISKQEQQPFISRVDSLFTKYTDLTKFKQRFITLLKADFKFEKITERLQKWYEMDWEGLQDEMLRLKKPIQGKKKIEWIDIFEDEKAKANEVHKSIKLLEKELNEMVYGIYGLTEAEINMIENE